MPVVAASENPSVGLPDGSIVTYTREGGFSVTRLNAVLGDAGMGDVEKALRRLLVKLTSLGVSFSLKTVSVEDDPEVRDWRYVVAEVELSVPASLFPPIEELLIEHTYSGLDAREATKLLLILNHV